MKSLFKPIAYIIMLSFITGCQDNILDTEIDPVDNNLPVIASLGNVDGLTTFSRGVYDFLSSEDVFESVGPEKESPMLWFTYGYHETMGDVLTMPWGNFGGRWVNQTQSVTLDDGTEVTPPAGGPQPGEIAIRNTRDAGSDNAIQYEWRDMYSIIVQCNTIEEALADLPADDATRDAFLAWSLWWRAYAHSRLGSIYEQGVVNESGLISNPTSIPSTQFVSNTELINRSNNFLNQLETLLNNVTDNAAFNSRFSSFHISYLTEKVDITELMENINTLRIRNLVYNTKVTDMTAADWAQVITLGNNGVSSNDGAFIMQSESSFIANGWLPSQVLGFWYFPSDRLIQDINPGDARFDDYFIQDPDQGFPFPNQRGRGIQYGASYFWQVNSGIVSNNDLEIKMYYAGSYEENQLFLAEAKVRTNDIEGGLAHLDAVRSLQESELPATVGTGLSQDQALEEIRKERRLALLFRAVAFYDARRYGVASGSRTGARVLDQNGNLNTNATINYGYLEYWPVPAFESDFNSIPSSLQ
ncbi:RagB/SusD family nutrient uptake outer membrane protein [Aquimarina gracilis]|uniref:RagB/SusD family nutrient uptake outer membrane protein n=1 Tax=Aquimarina gracilis TaxID=874422 RepID=A0ABU5ZS91_9FLAO|nr:RagB/SusD family nutrient uptake outer membrane protein [Aquimarina gracilis]MEB3344889.1 RagB/SusD family nutrient uptake outer membrane protein [Aquimarina gracilis]